MLTQSKLCNDVSLTYAEQTDLSVDGQLDHAAIGVAPLLQVGGVEEYDLLQAVIVHLWIQGHQQVYRLLYAGKWETN